MSLPVLAPAKINLWLRVFPPDPTGYHPLDTLFCTLELADELHIELGGDDVVLHVTGADLGPPHANLAWRAAHEFFATTGLPAGVRLELRKQIPVGAGLGGGSSDAAAVLQALNELHGHVVPSTDLMAMAARLGSDVPFFLCGSPVAHAGGYGERLRPLPALPPRPVLLVVPSVAVSTAEAYRWLDEKNAWSNAPTGGQHAPHTWSEVRKRAQNDFERVVFERYPPLRDIREQMLSSGALIAQLSGSGSIIYGIFEDEAEVELAERKLQSAAPACELLVTRTRQEPSHL